MPRYDRSQDLQRPIHPGRVADERAAFKVEEMSEVELHMAPPGFGIEPGEIGRQHYVGPQLLVPSKFVSDLQHHPCMIGLRQAPVAHICGDVVGKILDLLDHDVLRDDVGYVSDQQRADERLGRLVHQFDDRRLQLRRVDMLGDQVDGHLVAASQDTE
jgi:hypothetical protein